MNYMDEVPEMKGFYLVMDNAPIHTSDEIRTLIENRDYQCVYLPPYSPELNSIEQFLAIVKNKVRHSQFEDKEDLQTRITEASNNVPVRYLRNIIQHSVSVFDKCLERQPI
ncbi:hypothetical protein RMATCC62417_15105 [Rhizopus microsporus]|nr:hypothetical protein RMATCC62417_15105 [Rhizopus microsporus]